MQQRRRPLPLRAAAPTARLAAVDALPLTLLFSAALLVLSATLPTAVLAGNCGNLRELRTALSGTITDGEGPYPEVATCQWLIRSPPAASQSGYQPIALSFSEFATECAYDFLFVYDGDSTESRRIGAYSGILLPEPVVARSGAMLVVLYSDENYALSGFTANYSISPCPMNCSANGNCLDSGYCACSRGWTGEFCSVPSCPNACSAGQSQGRCLALSELVESCVCSPGFVGLDCSEPADQGTWATPIQTSWPVSHHRLLTVYKNGTTTQTSVPSSRDPTTFATSFHSSVYHPSTDAIFTFGGYSPSLQVHASLLLVNLTARATSFLSFADQPTPSPRYSHSAVLSLPSTMVVYGGLLSSEQLTSEVWHFDASALVWTLAAPSFPSDVSDAILPPSLSGHTATLVRNDAMIVIGGKSGQESFSTSVLQYNISSRVWRRLSVKGDNPSGVYGHSAVYSPELDAILVFGGIRPTYGFASYRVNELWIFQVKTLHWSRIRSASSGITPRASAFHLAWLTPSGDMVIKGGYVHSHYSDERCFTDDVLVYRVKYNQWADLPVSPTQYSPRKRMGHVALVLPTSSPLAAALSTTRQSPVVVTGGFSGVAMADVNVYSAALNPCSARVAAIAFPAPGEEVSVGLLASFVSICTVDPICVVCNASAASGFQPDSFVAGILSRNNATLACIPADAMGTFKCSQPIGPQRPPNYCDAFSTCSDCTEMAGCGWCPFTGVCVALSIPGLSCQNFSTIVMSSELPHANATRCILSPLTRGKVTREYWYGAGGTQVSDLQSFIEFPYYPNGVDLLFQTAVDNNPLQTLGQRLRGFVVPPETGSYRFFISASTSALLQISLTPDSVRDDSLQTVCSVNAPVGLRIFNAFPSQTSEPVALEANKRYLIVVLHKQLGQYDNHVAVAWMTPSQIEANPVFVDNGNGTVISSIFLEPFFSGPRNQSEASMNATALRESEARCSQLYPSCRSCLADSSCAWCASANACVSRFTGSTGNASFAACPASSIVTDSDSCQICFEYSSCSTCTRDPQCQWAYSACYRRDVYYISGGFTSPEMCPSACRQRTSCLDCLSDASTSCNWCEGSQQCDEFQSYIATNTAGQCTSWVTGSWKCTNCSLLADCKSCLTTPGCGWCGDSSDARKGACMSGDFGGPAGVKSGSRSWEETCPTPSSTWTFATCPNVDECALHLDNCHANATCVDIPESFYCVCSAGFTGDGVSFCSPVCDAIPSTSSPGTTLDSCGEHGICVAPNVCSCIDGWTGSDCNLSCYCNGQLNCSLAGNCVDVDECALGTSGCSLFATCINVPSSFRCECNPGYSGDGFSCLPVCANNCSGANGVCVSPGNCSCAFGFTGAACELDCGCNSHGSCVVPGECVSCQQNTQGATCNECVRGFFGVPTSAAGCSACNCGPNANVTAGTCDPADGTCICNYPFSGPRCAGCAPGFYYVDSLDRCFSSCDGRKILRLTSSGLGTNPSARAYPENSVCQWLISAEDLAAPSNASGLFARVPEFAFSGEFLNAPLPWFSSSSSSSSSPVFQSESGGEGEESRLIRALTREAEKDGGGGGRTLIETESGPERREVSVLQTGPAKSTRPSTITLQITRFSTECSYDFLFVFDGPSTSSPLLGSFSGSSVLPQPLVATSGYMLVVFYSDVNYVLEGFEANYKVSACAMNCSARGACDESTGICVCDSGYRGLACEVEICPSNCRRDISASNQCNTQLGLCMCGPAYTGLDCSVSVGTVSPLQWTTVFQDSSLNYKFSLYSSITGSSFNPRAAHTAAYDAALNAVVVFGGYDGSSQFGFLNDVQAFLLGNRTWVRLDNPSSPRPSPPQRHSHAMELDPTTRKLYVCGGWTKTGPINDVWSFDLATSEWTLLWNASSTTSVFAPVSGHSLTLAYGVLYLIGGRNSLSNMASQVLAFDLSTNTWSRLAVGGVVSPGVYGHTAVFSAPEASIYVFGGVRVPTGSSYPRNYNLLYAFSIATRKWRFVTPRTTDATPPVSSFHSASMSIPGSMMVVGGTSFVHGTGVNSNICHSSRVSFYSFACNTWLSPTVVTGSGFPRNTMSARFAHTSVLVPSLTSGKDTIPPRVVVIGGFDGRVRGDVNVISLPGNVCHLYGTEGQCRSDQTCSWCVAANAGTSSRCIGVDSISTVVCGNAQPSTSTCSAASVSCSSYSSCDTCTSSRAECTWCPSTPGGTAGGCIDTTMQACPSGSATPVAFGATCPGYPCVARSSSCRDCLSDTTAQCYWTGLMCTTTFQTNAVSKISNCPAPCANLTNCSSCVRSNSQSLSCLWCQTTSSCIDFNAYVSVYNLGTCQSWAETEAKCTPECSRFSTCSSCLSDPTCGWCADPGDLGGGRCMSGNDVGPYNEACGSTSVTTSSSSGNGTTSLYRWAYLVCPDENECLNGRSNCSDVSSECLNTPDGFTCVCKSGYVSRLGQCLPVCSKGCVQGTCIAPEVCLCNTGYVGTNCSLDCGCNGNSNCTVQYVCDRCVGNTVGQFCESCAWGYYKSGKSCLPCSRKCNYNSVACNPVNGTCYNCGGDSYGDSCQLCLTGFYKTSVDPNPVVCSPCDCNGHSNTCDPVSGICDCVDDTFGATCNKCKRGFIGTPVNGKMCYLVMSEGRLQGPDFVVTDAKRYYAISPKYTNVDIRVTIDVLKGEVFAFLSPDDSETPSTLTRSYSAASRRIDLVLPFEKYDFFRDRFYLSVSGVSNASFIVYYSQHVTQIDLFVFFSVFFASFFLFLSGLILMWKYRARRERLRAIARRTEELRGMARRPMSSVHVILSSSTPAFINSRLPLPFAYQPLTAGKAALATVVVELPGPGTNAAAQNSAAASKAAAKAARAQIEQANEPPADGDAIPMTFIDRSNSSSSSKNSYVSTDSASISDETALVSSENGRRSGASSARVAREGKGSSDGDNGNGNAGKDNGSKDDSQPDSTKGAGIPSRTIALGTAILSLPDITLEAINGPRSDAKPQTKTASRRGGLLRRRRPNTSSVRRLMDSSESSA